MSRLLLIAAACAAAAAVLWLTPTPGGAPPPSPSFAAPAADATHPSAPAESRTSRSPPELSPAAVNQQDRVSHVHERQQREAFESRALLAQLPLTVDGVRIDIAGLAADDRTTLLDIAPGPKGVDHARAVLRRILTAAGDDGTAYRISFRR